MGSKPSSQSNTTSTYSPPPTVLANYDAVTKQAQNVAATPYQAYGGQLVAGVNGQQQSGINAINSASGLQNPYNAVSGGLAGASASNIDPTHFSAGQVSQYENPYQSDVINATEAELQQQNAQQAASLQSNAISSGAFGGDRAGVAQAALAGQQAIANNATIAGLNAQNYNQALSEFNTQQQTGLAAQQNTAARQLAASQQLGTLGNTAQTEALNSANAQVNAGTLQQSTQQAQDTSAYNQFLQAQAYPFQTTGWLANIVEGIGSQSGGTTTGSQTTDTSTGSQIFGGLLGLGSLFLPKADGGRANGGLVPRRASGGGLGGLVPYAYAENGLGAGSIVPTTGALPVGHTMPGASSSGAPAQSAVQQGQSIGQIAKGIQGLGNVFENSSLGDSFNDAMQDAEDGFAHGGAVRPRFASGGWATGDSLGGGGFGGSKNAWNFGGGGRGALGFARGGLVMRNEFGGGLAGRRHYDDGGGVTPDDLWAASDPQGTGTLLSQSGGLVPSTDAPPPQAIAALRDAMTAPAPIVSTPIAPPSPAKTTLQAPVYSDPPSPVAIDQLRTAMGGDDVPTPVPRPTDLDGAPVAPDVPVGLAAAENAPVSDASVTAPAGLAYSKPAARAPAATAIDDASAPGGGLVTPGSSPAGGLTSAAPSGLGGLLSFLPHVTDSERQGLLAAALGMMAGTSRSALTNIGTGGLQGLAAYSQARTLESEMGLRSVQARNAAAEAAIHEAEAPYAAKKEQANLGLVNAQTEQAKALGQGAAAEAALKQSRVDMMHNFLAEHAKMQAAKGDQIAAAVDNPTAPTPTPSVRPNASPVLGAPQPSPSPVPPVRSQASAASPPPPQSGKQVIDADDPNKLFDQAQVLAMSGNTDAANQLANKAKAIMGGQQFITFSDGTQGLYGTIGDAQAAQAARVKAAETASGVPAAVGQKISEDDLQKAHDSRAGVQGALYRLGEMDEQVKNLPRTGFLSAGTAATERGQIAKGVNTFLQGLGGQPMFDPNNVAAIEELTKDRFRLGAELSRQIGGKEPGFIVQQSVSANPGADNSRVGYQRIVSGLRQATLYQRDYSNFLDQYFSQKGTTVGAPEAFERVNPQRGYVERAIASTVDPRDAQVLAQNIKNPAAISAFDKIYGAGVAKIMAKRNYDVSTGEALQ